jgi:hypothetical protein
VQEISHLLNGRAERERTSHRCPNREKVACVLRYFAAHSEIAGPTEYGTGTWLRSHVRLTRPLRCTEAEAGAPSGVPLFVWFSDNRRLIFI